MKIVGVLSILLEFPSQDPNEVHRMHVNTSQKTRLRQNKQKRPRDFKTRLSPMGQLSRDS